MEANGKYNKVHVAFSNDEYAKLKDEAHKLSISMAPLVRMKALNNTHPTITSTTPSTDPALKTVIYILLGIIFLSTALTSILVYTQFLGGK